MTLHACSQEAERAHAPKAVEPEEPEQAAESMLEAEQQAVAEMQARLDAALGMLARAQAALAAARDAAIAEVGRAHLHFATPCASTACMLCERGERHQAVFAVTKLPEEAHHSQEGVAAPACSCLRLFCTNVSMLM